MAIFVSFKENPDWIPLLQDAPIYKKVFADSSLPNELRLLRNPLGLPIQTHSRSGKHIVQGGWNCFIGLWVLEETSHSPTLYIVEAEANSDPYTAEPHYFTLNRLKTLP